MGTFGTKNVDFGGMFTPAAAISPICSTLAPGRKKAASKAPDRTCSTASASLRE